MPEVSFRVVDVDGYGHRVYPSMGEPWDKKLAEAFELLVRAGYALSQRLGKPIGTVTVSWGDSFAVVKYQDGRILGFIVEEHQEPPKALGKGLVGAEA